MQQTINTPLKDSGQVPQREPIDLIEQKSQVVQGLSDNEAACLKLLGQELRGTDLYWGRSQDDIVAEDDDVSIPSVIKVSRQPEDSGWRIQVGNAIGVIGVGDLQINVLPKIGEAHFNHIAEMAINPACLRIGRQIWDVAPDSKFLPAVWGAFLDALTVTLRAELHHDYDERTDDPPYVRGRLDVRRVAVNLARGKMNFPATFDELSSDNPVNRILRAAAEYVALAASNLANGSNSFRDMSILARETTYRLGEAGPLRSSDLELETPRIAAHQARALDLARHVLSGVGRSLKIGNTKVSCFLQPTPNLIEDGVRQLLDAKLGTGVSVKKRKRSAARLDFNPDLVVEIDHSPSHAPDATGDVKYRFRKEDWPREVLLQAMGFAQVFTASKAFFIDFGEDGPNIQTKTEKIREVVYHHVTWPIGKNLDPMHSEEHIIEELRRVILAPMASQPAINS